MGWKDSKTEILEWVWQKAAAETRRGLMAELDAARTELSASAAGIETYRASVVEALRDELSKVQIERDEAIAQLMLVVSIYATADDRTRVREWLGDHGFFVVAPDQ